MKSRILLLFFSCTLSLAWSQSIEQAREVTIENSFDEQAIQSYASQAQLKVEELVEYLTLIQNSENSEELNEQLRHTITQLFSQDEALQFTGIKSRETSTDLLKWIDDWKHSQVKIISMELKHSKLEDSYWFYEYQLIYEVKGKKKDESMNVKVYFKPQSKSFGKTTKKVWDFKIGHVLFF